MQEAVEGAPPGRARPGPRFVQGRPSKIRPGGRSNAPTIRVEAIDGLSRALNAACWRTTPACKGGYLPSRGIQPGAAALRRADSAGPSPPGRSPALAVVRQPVDRPTLGREGLRCTVAGRDCRHPCRAGRLVATRTSMSCPHRTLLAFCFLHHQSPPAPVVRRRAPCGRSWPHRAPGGCPSSSLTILVSDGALALERQAAGVPPKPLRAAGARGALADESLTSRRCRP